MVMSQETIAALQCQVGPSTGEPHDFDYNRGRGYRCKKCLARYSKNALKELTDDA